MGKAVLPCRVRVGHLSNPARSTWRGHLSLSMFRPGLSACQCHLQSAPRWLHDLCSEVLVLGETSYPPCSQGTSPFPGLLRFSVLESACQTAHALGEGALLRFKQDLVRIQTFSQWNKLIVFHLLLSPPVCLKFTLPSIVLTSLDT